MWHLEERTVEQDEAGEFEGNIKNVTFNRLSVDS